MRILVSHAGQQLGPFSIDELRRELAAGRVLTSDLAWWEGQPAWVQLSQVPGLIAPAAPFPASGVPAPVMFPGAPKVDDGSGLAAGSLVLGLMSLLFSCFTGIPAIVCGHMALSRQKRAGVSNSKSLAIIGLCLGYGLTILTIAGIAIFAALAAPALRSVGQHAKLTQSVIHAQQLISACEMYALTHDDEFPPSLDSLVPEHLPDASFLEDPLAPQFGNSGFYYIRPAKDDRSSPVVIAGHGTVNGKRAVARKGGMVTSEAWNPPADF
jgi:hypothetical protein